MKLISLELKYFRQHHNSRFDFVNGLTGIIGLNGAGKSTILESIGFALFGSKAIRGKMEDLPSRNLEKPAQLNVTLSFQSDNGIFRVERGLTEASLFIAGQENPLVIGQREVSARITSLLSMNYEEFISTYFTEQKGLEFLSGKKGATERERFVLKMIGLDRLEQMQELLRTDRRDLKNQVQAFESSLGDRSTHEKRLEIEQLEFKQVENELASFSQSFQLAQKEFERAKDGFDQLEKLQVEFQKINQQIEHNQIRKQERLQRQQNLANQLSKYRNLDQFNLNQELKNLIEKKSIAEVLQTEKEKFSSLENNLNIANSQLQLLEREVATEAQEQEFELKNIEQKISEINQKKLKLSKLDRNAQCPTCNQELGSSFDHVQQHFGQELELLNAKKFAVTKLLNQIRANSSNTLALKQNIEQTKIELSQLRSKLNILNEIDRSLASQPKTLTEYQALSQELEALNQKLDQLQEQKNALEFDPTNYSQIKTKLEASRSLVEIGRSQKIKAEGKLSTKTELIARTKLELERYDIKLESLRKLKNDLLILEDSDKILTGFRKHLNSSIRPRLAQIASEYLSELTDGRYTSIELSSDFSATVLEDGEAKAVISGGEEDILNLCMRLALSQILAERAGQSFSLLVLDEVFAALDHHRRTNVLYLLDKLKANFEQIIIITHLDDIKEGVERLIEVQYDEVSGLSNVREVSFDDFEFGDVQELVAS